MLFFQVVERASFPQKSIMAQPASAKDIARAHEFLSPARAAALCCVSEARFESWIHQGLVPVVRHGSRKMVKSRDLIQHLINHNIRIPEALLQGGRKKILFIALHEQVESKLAAAAIRLLHRLRNQEDCIVDFIRHGEHTELKVITFEPDRIVLLGTGEAADTLLAALGRLLTPQASIECLHPSGLQQQTASLTAR